MTQAANDLHLESPSLLGRWKVTGIHESIGLEGALAFSTSQHWTPVEILYISNQQMVFLADNLGKAGPMQYLYCGTPRQIKFKAVKSHARTLQKQASEQATASASAARPKMISSADRQKEFYAKVHKSVPAPKTLSSPAKESELVSFDYSLFPPVCVACSPAPQKHTYAHTVW